jgi:hypothetical protein
MPNEEPRPLGGWRRVVAVVWAVCVIGLYLLVREGGWTFVP